MPDPTEKRCMDEESRAGLPIKSFQTAAAFERWLSLEPRTTKGIWLKIAKKGSGQASLTKSEAVDAALCHGWIDRQQDRLDAQWWLTRFTPRRKASRWSEINRTRVLELIESGDMRPAGFAEIDVARADGRWAAAYPSARTALVPYDLQLALDRSENGKALFTMIGKSARYALLYRISNARKPETRQRLISAFIACLEDNAACQFQDARCIASRRLSFRISASRL